jgi:hypothetical protein
VLASPHPLRNYSNGKLVTVAVVLMLLLVVESGENHTDKENKQGRSQQQQQQQWLQQQQHILPLINNPLPHLWLLLPALSRRGVQALEGQWLS